MTTIYIVDDQQIIIDGLRTLLSADPNDEIEIAGFANSGFTAEMGLKSPLPDVVLMDLNMPGKDGIETTETLVRRFPEIRILMLTGYDELELIREALRKGAKGYILKNAGRAELIRAIFTVADGKRYLDPNVQEKVIESFVKPDPPKSDPHTAAPNPAILNILSKREIEVLRLIVVGKTSPEIAKELFISLNTVDTHRKNILSKCGVKNAAELSAFAHKNGLV